MKIKTKNGIRKANVDSEEIKEQVKKIMEKSLCANCYCTYDKMEGITLEKPRVTEGIELESTHRVAVLECKDYHKLKYPSTKEPKNTKNRDIERYGEEVATISDAKVLKLFRDMK